MMKILAILVLALSSLVLVPPSLSHAQQVERVYDVGSGKWVERKAGPRKAPVRRYQNQPEPVSATRWEQPVTGSGGSSIARTIIPFAEKQAPGTVIVDTSDRRLYHVLDGGKAMAFGVGVGREGFTWSGTDRVSRKAEWPSWTPPAEMRRREAAKGKFLPVSMAGGPDNPLGARALYIGSTLYRIHGTSQPWTIGQAVSSGCIRLTNEDITYLYDQISVGTRVVVRR